ncbi:MAG: DUF1194 domain-containing protein [Alphaproteobacteria bacterium]|nr:DUF1194 domain-containing protein [Alphaproteobacteria bacterium]
MRMMRRQMMRAAAGVALAPLAAREALAGPMDVDLRLVLAVDVSRSVDAEEYELQKDGYARALTDQRIVDAITSGPLQRIGLCYVEWAGPQMQRTPIDWILIDSKASCERVAARISGLPYEPHSWTGVGAAMRYAAGKFESGPFHSRRMVIDVSGDGRNNNGPPADIVRDELVAKNIVINGLPIVSDKPNFGRPPERDLDRWYEENVIGGPGSFMMVANGFGDFARAVRNKLSREIA